MPAIIVPKLVGGPYQIVGLTSGGAAYTGPGDIKSGALVWYGLRAYSAAYAAAHGNVVQVCDSAGNNPLTITANTDGSITAPGPTACGGGACTLIKTLYDQSGNGHDVTQATAAKMPTFSPTGSPNSKPIATFVGANSTILVGTTAASTLAVPFSWSIVFNRTSDSGVMAYGASTNLLRFQSAGAGNSIKVFDGNNNFNFNKTDGTWNSVQAINVAGAGASQVDVDGTATTGTLGSSPVSASDAIYIGAPTASVQFYDGKFAEGGVWGADLSSPDVRSSLNSNAKTYWGY